MTDETAYHRWSGWPGAWCLDCGAEDANEAAIAGGADPDTLDDQNAPCPEPGSRRHDPYSKPPKP